VDARDLAHAGPLQLHMWCQHVSSHFVTRRRCDSPHCPIPCFTFHMPRIKDVERQKITLLQITPAVVFMLVLFSIQIAEEFTCVFYACT
jgi:hypothetical protein